MSTYSSRWFSVPPFLEGAASVFDLFGVLPSEADRILARSDAEAIASDWRAVGLDLFHAISSHRPSEQNLPPKKLND